MIDLLVFRTIVSWGIFLLALVIFLWSQNWIAFFLGLYGITIIGVRMALVYDYMTTDCLEYQLLVTATGIWIFIALLLLARSIWIQRNK
jgi:hypothetical protein